MRQLIGGVGGALLVAGSMVMVAGWRGIALPHPFARRPRGRESRPRGRWAQSRWPVAFAAGAVAWGLTRWPVAGVLVAAGVVGLPVLLSTASVAKARIARVEAIEEWTRRLSDVLAAGSGLGEAITTTARTCPPALQPEVTALVARLNARWPIDRALSRFGEEVADPAGDLVVAALLLAAHRRGPGLAAVLAGVAGSIGEDVAARRRIEAERARPRTTAKAVTVITLVVLAAGAASGTYLTPYGDPLGQVVLAVLAAGFAGCLVWMRHLTLPPAAVRHLALTPGEGS